MILNKTKSRFWFLILFVIWKISRVHGSCLAGEVETFERVTGMVPMIFNQTLMLSRAPGPEPITVECIKRCLAAGDTCHTFVVDYVANACFRVELRVPADLFGFSPAQFGRLDFEASNLVFYEKICLKAARCGELLWLVDRVPGFELRTPLGLTVNVTNRQDCAALCISERRFLCRSAQFDARSLQCLLSGEDQRSIPYAFVPSTSNIDYLENQCAQFMLTSARVCAYEEFNGNAFNFTDATINGVSYKKCRQMCDSELRFRCRGFTYVGGAKLALAQISTCLLHSSDVASVGPDALVPVSGATYSERAPCLDILLRCSKNTISLKLRTREPFYGRLFVRGFTNVCDVSGSGGNETSLTVGPRCATFSEKGVNVAVVVQYSAILQRRGDRALNVTCTYGESLLAAVNGSIQVDGDPFLGGSLSVNTSDLLQAAVRIVITDRQGREASITEVGRDLELRIEALNTDPFDISAGQLIASNVEGTESVLLLDERGCPPDPATFPALEKVNGSKDLVAHFRAFRFTSSTVVRFLVRVHFCLNKCPPVSCGKGVVSYGRRRRDHLSSQEDPAVLHPPPPRDFPKDMPLEMDIMVLPDPHAVVNVQSNVSVTDPEQGRDHPSPPDEGWCVSEGVFIGVLVAWLVLQVLLVVTVWIAATLYVQSDQMSVVRLRNVKWDDQAFS